MSTALAPPAADFQLWTRFQSGRCSSDEIASSRVLQRWQRCRNGGLSPDNPGEPLMAVTGLAETLDEFTPLLAPGAPFDAFATALAQHGFCGVLCDASGRVLSRRVAEPFEATTVTTSLIEGAVWSEAARGTNGMGTALFENAPVSIVGAEHFEQRNHVLACYGAPIRDVRERLVAVLDATGPVSSAGGFIHASVVAAAAALEALIIGRTYDAALPGGLFALERLIERLPHAALVLETTGRVRRANAPFRALLGEGSESRAGRALAELAAGGRPAGARPAAAADAFAGMALEFEPVGPAGDPIASIVHVVPRGARRRAATSHAALPEAFAPILGSDAALGLARAQAARFARTNLPVLLLGETGTGKELFARAIHATGTRADGPFVAVNAGALSGTLLESELFGYAPGAFTGAVPGGRTGKLAAADGGTLFLDEVGEMSPSVQAMLLRFLEGGVYYRLGEAVERRADVRLVAATSRDLPALAETGRFRSDLYFRLRGVILRLPALRDRSDRMELAETLLAGIAADRALDKPLGLAPGALAWIERHDWPGNVREMRAALEYAVVLAGDAPRIELWHLPADEPPAPAQMGAGLASAERAALLAALSDSRGNLSAAARRLGVARSTLYRMMARHGLRIGRTD